MTTTQPTASSRNLIERVFGVFFSPRATYTDVAARPRVLGALVLVVVIIAGANFAFLSTEVGRRAMVDQQLDAMESFGVNITDQMVTTIEQRSAQGRYFTLGGVVVFVPIAMAIMAGVGLVVFNAILGGDATFKQVYAIVVHSGFIGALQVLFVTPLNYVRESMASATSLNIFLPMIDSTGFAGMFLGSMDLFRIWSLVSLAIGFGVLYKKQTGPIAGAFLAVYIVIVLIVAGVRTALSGA